MNVANPSVITLRTLRPTPSRIARWIAWLSIPWALGVIFGLNAFLVTLGMPPSEQPVLLRLLLVVLAVAPGAMSIAGPWLGRRHATAWLLAQPQPEARLDAEGIRLTLPGRPVLFVAWSDVRGLSPSRDLDRSGSLVATDGHVIAKVPWDLVVQRAGGPGPHSLAEAVVAIRPDRYALKPPDRHSIWPSFALRDPGLSPETVTETQRWQFSAALVVLMILVGFGVIMTIVWMSSTWAR